MATRTISTKLAIEGEAQYRQALSSCNAELKTLKSSLALAESEYKNNANSMEALTAKGKALSDMQAEQAKKVSLLESALKNAQSHQQAYADAAADAGKKVAQYAAELEKLKSSTGDTQQEQAQLTAEIEKWTKVQQEAEAASAAAVKGVQSWQQQLNSAKIEQNSLSEAAQKNSQHLEEAAASADGCAKSIDQYGKEVKEAGEASEQFGNTSKGAVDALAQAIVAAGLAEKVKDVTAALYDCVDTFAAFEAQMSTVQSISGATAEEMAELTEKAKYMGSTTSFTAEEAGKALEYMAMAGWKTEDMLDGLDGVLSLAAASGEDLATTSDIVTDALTAFGLKAEDSAHFADVLARASSNSNTNVRMMGETFKYAAPVAGTLGYSIEDTALAIGLMANASIKGSQAGTTLRSIFTRLATDAGASSTKLGALGVLTKQLGVEFFNTDGSARALNDVLMESREAWQTLTEEQQTTYAKTIAGQEAMSGWMAIMNASVEDVDKLTSALSDCSGAAYEMSQIKLDNFSGQLTLLDSEVDGLELTIGSQLAPVLEEMARGATTAVGGLRELLEACPALTAVLVGLTASTGALTAAFAGFSILRAAKSALIAFNGALAKTPAGLAAIAIVGVVSALGTLSAYYKDATAGASGLNSELREIEGTYQKTASETMATASAAEQLIDRLAALEAQESMTEGEAALYARTVDELRTLMPELNIEIDAQTGFLVGGTDALRENTEAWKENALAQALQEKYQEIVSAQADALIDAAEKQLAYNDALAACTELELQMAETAAELQRVNNDSTLSYEEKAARIADLTQRMDLLAAQQLVATEGMNAQKNALEAAQGKTAEFDEALDHLKETEDALSDSNEDHAASMDVVASHTNDVTAALEALGEEYNTAYNEARESLDKQIGLFEKLDGTAKTSIDDLIKTLQGQVSYFDSYADNIKLAMEKGVDEGLVRKLSDGSVESAQILDAIVKGGNEKILALNTEFAKVEAGKDKFGEIMTELEGDFSARLEELGADLEGTIQDMDLSDDAYTIGQNNIQGLINGAASKTRELIDQYQAMAREAQAAYMREADQHSPSKKFQKIGSNDIKGIIEGAGGEKESLVAAYSDVAKAAVDSVEKALPSDVLTQSLQQSKKACEDLLRTIGGQRYEVTSAAASMRELLAVEEKSAAQKEIISRRVDELNEAVPELGLAYDSVSDSINMTGDALERLVEKSAEQQEYEARVSRLSELYIEQEKIALELEAAREALSQAEEAGAESVQILQESVSQLTTAQEENAVQIRDLESATGDYGDRQAEAAAKVEQMTTRLGELTTEVDNLYTAYEDIRKKAADSMESQLGLFKDLDANAEISIDSLIDSLRGQVDYMLTYANNIKRAMEMGIDNGLLSKLSDGRKESAQILAAIVQGGQRDIDALNEQFAKVELGKEYFAKTVADMEVEFRSKMGELVNDLNDALNEMDLQEEMYTIGMNNLIGLINGADSQREELVKQYTEMGKVAMEAYKREVDQHSPSKKFMQMGSNDILGIIEGVEREKASLAAAYEESAQAALRSMERAMPSTFRVPQAVDNRTAAPADTVSNRWEDVPPIQIYVDRMEVRKEGDAQRVAQELYYLTARELRSRGGGML